MQNETHAIRQYVVGFSLVLLASGSLADENKVDVQTFLPLLERNSLGRKVLDVSYTFNFDMKKDGGESYSGRQDVHLVYDAESGMYREETKHYGSSFRATGKYQVIVDVWNGKEYLSWARLVSNTSGFSSPGQGVYEDTGGASIKSRPFSEMPCFVQMFYDPFSLKPLTEAIHDQNPKLSEYADDVVIIDSQGCTLKFLKRTGVLQHLVFYAGDETDDKNEKRAVWKTYDFSDHVDCSGVWMPLRIVMTELSQDGGMTYRGEFSVDPKTLRLLDKADDSTFNETLPAGCAVSDQIRKKEYTVTTVDTLPNDIEAVKQTLEKMLKQAEEQKAALEKKK